jgi:hypothetical protein
MYNKSIRKTVMVNIKKNFQKHKSKKAGSVAEAMELLQVYSPEFKPPHCQKKRRKRTSCPLFLQSWMAKFRNRNWILLKDDLLA